MKRSVFVSSGLVIPVGALGSPAIVRAQSGGTAYKIGFTAPLTGPLAASMSAEEIPGIELAIADVNRRGGIKGHQLQLLVEDTQGNPQGGIAALRKLVEVDGVQVAMTIYTNVATAQIPLADQLKVPLLAPVEGVGVMSAGQYSFAHAVTYPDVAPFYQAYWRKANARRIFGILGNNGYGQSISPAVRTTAIASGADYDQAFVDLNQTDFRGLAIRVKEFNPDQIFMSLQGSSVETAILRQLREMNVTTQIVEQGNFYQSHAWQAGAGPYAEGMIFGGLYINPTTSRDFVHAYQNRTGTPPAYGVGELYDIVHMIAYAIDKGGYNGEAIRNALLALRGVPSIFGSTIVMKPNHYTQIGNVGLWQVRHGVQVSVKP